MKSTKKGEFCALYTPEGETLCAALQRGEQVCPWEKDYPRPQLRRDSYACLNGFWDFCEGDAAEWERILVPFAPESLLSGIHRVIRPGVPLHYRTHFSLPDGFARGRVILHFGAVDQVATVRLNGQTLGTHEGGYESFSFDITDVLQAQNELLVDVIDDADGGTLPYGKQRRQRGGMWYTTVSGIWQTVWLESVPERYVSALRLTPNGQGATLEVDMNDGSAAQGEVTVTTPQGEERFVLTDGVATLAPRQVRCWSPEDPYLYAFALHCGEDTVHSYFAIRVLEVRTFNGLPRLCLNGEPYFFHGLLDQGYWSDGIYTPADPLCYEKDILTAKALGFNMLRKHIKVEAARFYYECDRLGMVVFQDMVNNGAYSFIRDTALPTVGLKKRRDGRMHRDADTRAAFEAGMRSTVRSLYNHPSVCYWTVFNEGWGQFESQRMQALLRELDSTRLIDTASGWFDAGADSDVESLHIYFKPVRISPAARPVVLSEFGGFSYAVEQHIFNPSRAYGYGRCGAREELAARLVKVYREEILPAVERGLCATVYTQLSDVEDEINGILTYDRRVCKLLAEEFLPVSLELRRKIGQK